MSSKQHTPNTTQYDPESVRITDLLKQDQVMEAVSAFRMGGKAEAGVFVRHDTGVCLIDGLYGVDAPSCSPCLLSLAEKVLETGESQRCSDSDCVMVIAHPIWLRYHGSSYIKGCLVGSPPAGVKQDELDSCGIILKIVADTFSDKVTSAFLSEVVCRDHNILEEKLRFLNDPIATVINSVSAACLLVDRDMTVRWHNTALVERLERSNLIGKVCYKEIFAKDSICPGCLVHRTFETGESQAGNLRIDSTAWNMRHFQIATAPVHDECDKVTHVLELVHDITAERKAESELACYKRLVNNSDDLMVVCNGNFEILAANRKFQEECQYTEKELIGKHVLDLVPTEEHGRSMVIAGMLRVAGIAMESLHLMKKDSSLIPTQLFATYDSETDIYEAVFRDMSERLHLEQEIRARSEELQAQNTKVMAAIEEKSRFFRNVSHELRTPLTSVIGFAELLLEDAEEPLSDRQKMRLSRVVSNSHKLLSMVNDLLDLSRLDAGRMCMEWAGVDLKEFIGHIVSNMMPLAKAKKLHVSVFVPKKLPRIITDEHKLGQIVVNLLSNAIKFTHKGSVTVKANKNARSILISVIDTGIGIPESELDEIFKEFSRGSTSDAKNIGTGLGLAIAKRLAGFLGGEISVRSKVGEGSTFILKLPIVPDKVTASAV